MSVVVVVETVGETLGVDTLGVGVGTLGVGEGGKVGGVGVGFSRHFPFDKKHP